VDSPAVVLLEAVLHPPVTASATKAECAHVERGGAGVQPPKKDQERVGGRADEARGAARVQDRLS
jgi:hypothetical protein